MFTYSSAPLHSDILVLSIIWMCLCISALIFVAALNVGFDELIGENSLVYKIMLSITVSLLLIGVLIKKVYPEYTRVYLNEPVKAHLAAIYANNVVYELEDGSKVLLYIRKHQQIYNDVILYKNFKN